MSPPARPRATRSLFKFSNLAGPRTDRASYSRFPSRAPPRNSSRPTKSGDLLPSPGTPQSEDRLVFATPDRPRLSNRAEVSEDGRWLIVSSSEGTDARHEITLIDLTRPGAAPRRLIAGFEHEWAYLGNEGTTFYWRTNNGAPRQRIVSTDIARPRLVIRELVAQDAATLDDASIVGRQLIAEYLVDAKSEVRTFSLAGERTGAIRRQDRSVNGFGSTAAGRAFFSFHQLLSSDRDFRYDSATGRTATFAEPRLAFDPSLFQVRQVFYRSKDGTRVPMFLVHRRDLDLRRPQPTLLYAYGGFNAAELPRYQPRWMTWVDMGGVLAVAKSRRGEYGAAGTMPAGAPTAERVDDFIALPALIPSAWPRSQRRSRALDRGPRWAPSSTSGRTCFARPCPRSG